MKKIYNEVQVRGIFFYLIYALTELRNRCKIKKAVKYKPVMGKFKSYHPYSPKLSLGEKYKIIGEKMLENRMICKK